MLIKRWTKYIDNKTIELIKVVVKKAITNEV